MYEQRRVDSVSVLAGVEVLEKKMLLQKRLARDFASADFPDRKARTTVSACIMAVLGNITWSTDPSHQDICYNPPTWCKAINLYCYILEECVICTFKEHLVMVKRKAD
jgi:hypothetical protein